MDREGGRLGLGLLMAVVVSSGTCIWVRVRVGRELECVLLQRGNKEYSARKSSKSFDRCQNSCCATRLQ